MGPRDHSRRAVSALQAVMLAKGLLQGMERAVRLGDAFDVVTSAPSAWMAKTCRTSPTGRPDRRCRHRNARCRSRCAGRSEPAARAGSGSARCAARPVPRPGAPFTVMEMACLLMASSPSPDQAARSRALTMARRTITPATYGAESAGAAAVGHRLGDRLCRRPPRRRSRSRRRRCRPGHRLPRGARAAACPPGW